MEKWESFLDSYPSPADLRSFGKALQLVGAALKEDLAPFEIEWLIETLLHRPINLPTTVRSNHTTETWSHYIGNSFKLLTEIVNAHEEVIEPYLEKIVALCSLPLEPSLRKHSLLCLTAITVISPLPSASLHRHVATLTEGGCTTEKVLLIGSICKHHPESATELVTDIWRTLLNFMESNKNTDRLNSALLQAVQDLFKHFGRDLPTIEVYTLYDKIVHQYLRSPCEEVCLRLLSSHWELFMERLSRDSPTREHLWEILRLAATSANRGAIKVAIDAINSSYNAVLKVDTDRVPSILQTEVLPRTQSPLSQIKYTALRIMTRLRQSGATSAGDHDVRANDVDVHTLEFELRTGTVTYDVAEAISWCIESRQLNCENLLQTAILFTHHLPAGRMKEIVVYGILNAPTELRKTVVTFLTNETIQTQDEQCMETHYRTWQALFDTDKGKDCLVVEKCGLVFEDFVNYTFMVFDNFLGDEFQSLPRVMIRLLALSSHILSLQRRDDHVTDLVSILSPMLLEMATKSESAEAVRALTRARVLLPDDFVLDFGQLFNLNLSRDEETLCAKCELIVECQASVDVDVSNVTSACDVIFGRNDVEYAVMIKTLKIFEKLVQNGAIRSTHLSQILTLLSRQRARKDMTGKQSRIFRRDLVMFIAKYGRGNTGNSVQYEIITKIPEISIHIPEQSELVTHKINLREILRVAIQSENMEILETFLTVICVNAPTSQSLLEYALPRTVLALSRAYSRTVHSNNLLEQLSSVRFGNECVGELITYISYEVSPFVRKMLSAVVESALMSDHSAGLLGVAVERAANMMTDESTSRAGLDITETILIALKENNAQTKESLPRLLELISNTYELESENVFESGAKVFVERIELFDAIEVDGLIKTLLCQLIEQKEFKLTDVNVRIYKKIVKSVVEFVKTVHEYRKEDISKVPMTFFEVFNSNKKCDVSKVLYVLSDIHNIFGLDLDMSRKVVSYNDYCIHNMLFCMVLKCETNDHFCMEAVLKFMTAYCVVLLEMQYQKTLEHLGNLIKTLTPVCVIYLHKTLSTCLSVYKDILNALPRTLLSSLNEWCQKLHLNDITNSIQKESFTEEHVIIVNSVKYMLSAFDLTLTNLIGVTNICQKWSQILLKLFSRDYIQKYLKSKLSYLNDLMTVSLQCLKLTDVKKLLLEGYNLTDVSNEKIGVRFCRYFISAFFPMLMLKPYVLLDPEMSPLSILLCDIVKHVSWKKCSEQLWSDVLELVDELWPTFVSNSTFEQQHNVLLKLNNSVPKLRPDSKPLLWAVDTIANGDREVRARLVAVLPGGEEFSSTYTTIASTLPSRLSELSVSSSATLRALVDALAATGDHKLFGIVATLVAGEDSEGWWATAVDSCMASLAAKSNLCLLRLAYKRSFHDLSLGVCRKILLPLLRYSPSSLCEQFYSETLKDLLSKLQVKPNKAGYEQMKLIADYTRTFIVLQLAFEKLPTSYLSSPSSALYTHIPTPRAWHISWELCRSADQLMRAIPTAREDTRLRGMDRQLWCAYFNSKCAAICRWQVKKPLLTVFNVQLWEKLVDDTVWDLPLINTRSRRTLLHPVSISLPLGTSSTSSGTTMTSSVTSSFTSQRSKMFLRTLSENVLQFDLIETEEEIKSVEVSLSVNAVNSHECASTLTALFKSCDSLAAHCDVIVTALTSCSHNVRALVAQTICNSKEELTPLATLLRPALLAYITDTAIQTNGKTTLHQLHIDVIETLISWSEENPDPSLKSNRDAVLSLLLTTCMENQHRSGVFNTLYNTLTNWLDLYGNGSTVEWRVFEPYLEDYKKPSKRQTPHRLFKILSKLAKAKIHLPLIPIVFSHLQQREYKTQMSEIFGLAVSYQCQSDMSRDLSKFKRILEDVRAVSAAQYVTMLYSAQIGCPDVCDEKQFRMATDQIKKLTGPEKTKCLKILANYISAKGHQNQNCVTDMFDSLDFCEIIGEDNLKDVASAIEVVKAGFEVLNDTLKRRLVNVIADKCLHNDVSLRTVACDVILMDFKELTTPPPEPLPKRPRSEHSRVLNFALGLDGEYDQLLRAVAIAVTENRGLVAQLLSTQLTHRFKECFALTVILPLKTCSNKNELDLGVCTSTFLELLFSDLRARDGFKNVMYREQDLEIRPPNEPSNLLSRTRSYHGSFIRRATSDLNTRPAAAGNDAVSLDTLLGNILRFTESNSLAACALIAQLAVTLKVSEFIPPLCLQPSPLAPLVLTLASCENACQRSGLTEALTRLKETTVGSESEWLVNYLYRDITLDTCDEQLLVLGHHFGKIDHDVPMDDLEFDIEDVVSSFGQLSNWTRLTIHQRTDTLNKGLPRLWTDKGTFTICIGNYNDPNGWFGKMVQAYRRQDKQNTLKWLRGMDLWPRRYFQLAAVAEAIEWQWNEMNSLYQCNDMNSLYQVDIQDGDCMAEWAARLMIRTAYMDTLPPATDNELRNIKLSHSHELKWCERANEMGLHDLVLDCVERNCLALCASEVVPWLCVRGEALRGKGTQHHDFDEIRKEITRAEYCIQQYSQISSGADITSMNKLILELHQDLNSLSPEKLQTCLQQCDQISQTNISETASVDLKAAKNIVDICQIAMTYYSDIWDNCSDDKSQETILVDMMSALEKVSNVGSKLSDIFLDVILDKIDQVHHVLGEHIAKRIMDYIQTKIQSRTNFALQQMRAKSGIFPSHLFAHYPYMCDREGATFEKYTKCLQTLCDAEYTLMNYCGVLQTCLRKGDAEEWTTTLKRMKDMIFENPYSGSDYLLLNKYKDVLYGLAQFELSENFQNSTEEILKSIIRELGAKKSQSQNTLKLSQLCPTLTYGVERDSDTIAKLLGLHGVKIIGFSEQIRVFTMSLRRPVLLEVRTNTGRGRRYLVKVGDDLSRDAASLRAAAVAATLGDTTLTTYQVTPLTADCGVIEYLEDHQRMRDLISQQCHLDVSTTVNPPRPADPELIVSPARALLHFQSAIGRIPARALRRALRETCLAMNTDHVASSAAKWAVIGWILGLGDRHLENILWSRDGAMCYIDWAAILRYDGAEIPPARLTRNVVAACESNELESHMQKLLHNLRKSKTLYLASIRVAFKGMGDRFEQKFPYIKSILEGTSTSCQITKDAILKSKLKHKDKYVDLLEDIFIDLPKQEIYTVEQQVSVLLRQCTEPRILSVTRSGWEPWV